MDATLTTPDPVCAALFMVEGKPRTGRALPTGQRTCGACRRDHDCVPAGQVLSANFGTWDDIVPSVDGRWLCPSCVWAYTNADLRRGNLVVTTAPSVERPVPSRLRALLSSPIPPTTAVVVPVGGKRSLVPTAQWGKLTFDGGTIPWSAKHARLMHTAAQLRDWGAHEKSLQLPSPPMAMMDALPIETHSDVRALWRSFDPARNDDLLFPLMCRLTRKDPR